MTNVTKNSELLVLFEPPPPTDPVEDLAFFIEKKIAAIEKYSVRPDRREEYLKRLVAEAEELQSIADRLQSLKLYSLWARIEALIQKNHHATDGLILKMPFVQDPKNSRLLYIDLTGTK